MKTRGAKVTLLALPFGMASAWLERLIINSHPVERGDSRAAAFISFYGSMVITYLACTAISIIALPYVEEVRPGHSKPRRISWKQVGALLTIATVAPIGTIAGLAAAVIPGIIVWLSWVVAAPAAVWKEQGAFEALRHSARLTWGSRRALFYVFATIQITTFVLGSAITLALGHSVQSIFDDPTPLSPLETMMSGLLLLTAVR